MKFTLFLLLLSISTATARVRKLHKKADREFIVLSMSADTSKSTKSYSTTKSSKSSKSASKKSVPTPTIAPSSAPTVVLTNAPTDVASSIPTMVPTSTTAPGACPTDCSVLSYMIFVDEVWESEIVTDETTFYQVRLYDENNYDLLGTVTSRVIAVSEADCHVFTTYNLDYNATTGKYDSQLFVEGTCEGATNVIKGGTGTYCAAYGYEEPNNDGILETIKARLHVCTGCCPP